MANIAGGTGLGLKQYTKDVPPGWRPRSYPIREYRDYLTIWGKLTRLEAAQVGPAVMSRLEGGALRLALSMSVDRIDENTGQMRTYTGAEAVCLMDQQAIIDQYTGVVIQPEQMSGARLLINKLMETYHLDDQDLAWTSLDQFFSFRRPDDMDFASYVCEWERLLGEATRHGGLQLNDVGKS